MENDTPQTPNPNAPDFAKVFWSGNSQAVRLPKSFRFDSDEVELVRVGDGVLITPKPKKIHGSQQQKRNTHWDDFFAAIPDIRPEDNFMNDRPLNVIPEERDIF